MQVHIQSKCTLHMQVHIQSKCTLHMQVHIQSKCTLHMQENSMVLLKISLTITATTEFICQS